LRGEEFEFAKLMMDIMIPPEISEALRGQGYDVLKARELPPEIYQDDRLLLEEATKQGRVLVTCNYSDPQSNFILIHEEWQRKGREHAGIILVPQFQISHRMRRWEVRDRLVKFLNRVSAKELRNQILWLPQD
jgi:hypothetical protein